MPDTVRTKAELLTLFPDNTTQEISPQDIRDFVVSTLTVLDNKEDQTYVHVQNTPATIWVVVHNLGKHPSVSVVDSAGTAWIAEVSYTDVNTLEIRHAAPFSGKAYLN